MNKEEAIKLVLSTMSDHDIWWNQESSEILPLLTEDMQKFVHHLTRSAWFNGAVKEREACAKIARQLGGDWAEDAIRARGQE
jgi:hypothetical protein